jgi:hypothetical protein
MQAATSNNLLVTPSVIGNADSAAKAHGAVTSNALAAGSFNVASVSHSGTGVYVVSFTTGFSSATYTVVTSVDTPNRISRVTGKLNGSFTVSTADPSGASPGDADFEFVVFGRQ